MLSLKEFENEFKQIINQCITTQQVGAVTKAIQKVLYKTAKAKRTEIQEAIPFNLESFFEQPPSENDPNYKSIFESKRDLEIAEEYL